MNKKSKNKNITTNDDTIVRELFTEYILQKEEKGKTNWWYLTKNGEGFFIDIMIRYRISKDLFREFRKYFEEFGNKNRIYFPEQRFWNEGTDYVKYCNNQKNVKEADIDFFIDVL